MRTHSDTYTQSTISRLFEELRLVSHSCDPPCGDCPPLGIRFDDYNRLEREKLAANESDVIDRSSIQQ